VANSCKKLLDLTKQGIAVAKPGHVVFSWQFDKPRVWYPLDHVTSLLDTDVLIPGAMGD
jgi:hypothetical protein